MRVLIVFMTMAIAPAWGQSKQDISNMLEQMEKMGTFTPEQIEAAKKQLNSMSDSDINNMVQKGKAAANDPKVRAKAQEMIKKYKDQGGKIPGGDNNGVTP